MVFWDHIGKFLFQLLILTIYSFLVKVQIPLVFGIIRL